MENEKTYLNSIGPTKVQLATGKEGQTQLIIDFTKPEGFASQFSPRIWLDLVPERNESNVKAVRALGATCPDELKPNAALNLEIREAPTIVCVNGKPRYINEGRKLKVFDNRK